MKTSTKYLLAIILIAMQVACKPSDESDSIKERLIGTWILDSVSTPSGEYYKPDNRSTFNLMNEN